MRYPPFAASGRRALDKLAVLPPTVKLLLASMTLFNIGFYLVIPFLAVHLSENLGLAAWLVGLVLGLRMLSQQGMFFLGGSLADRFGVRPVILVGIAIRVAGFLWLGFAESTASVIISVLMIGFAAALFAPAVESTNASFGRDLEERGVMRRTELFALEQMCSRLGTVIGPALGAALLAFPFSWTASVAAALFVGMWIGFFALLPRAGANERVSTYTLADVWRSVLVNKRFLAFAAMCSCQLLAYSQLYLMLPEQLQRGVGSQDALGWFYVGAALLVILGQAPTVAVANRIGHRAAVTAGLALISASFLAPVALGLAAPSALSQLTGLALWIGLLHLGQMLMVPPMRDTIAVLAEESNLGAHFGMLNTIGGIFSLVGTLGVGWIYDQIDAGHAAATLPWWVVAAVVALAAGALWLWSGRTKALRS